MPALPLHPLPYTGGALPTLVDDVPFVDGPTEDEEYELLLLAFLHRWWAHLDGLDVSTDEDGPWSADDDAMVADLIADGWSADGMAPADDSVATARAAAFNRAQPRVPAGSPEGGRWTDGDGATEGSAAPSAPSASSAADRFARPGTPAHNHLGYSYRSPNDHRRGLGDLGKLDLPDTATHFDDQIIPAREIVGQWEVEDAKVRGADPYAQREAHLPVGYVTAELPDRGSVEANIEHYERLLRYELPPGADTPTPTRHVQPDGVNEYAVVAYDDGRPPRVFTAGREDAVSFGLHGAGSENDYAEFGMVGKPLQGATLTHNHPRLHALDDGSIVGSTLSEADIGLAVNTGARAIRAVTHDGVYEWVVGDRPSMDELNAAHDEIKLALRVEQGRDPFWRPRNAGEWFADYGEILRRMAARYRATYRYRPHGGAWRAAETVAVSLDGVAFVPSPVGARPHGDAWWWERVDHSTTLIDNHDVDVYGPPAPGPWSLPVPAPRDTPHDERALYNDNQPRVPAGQPGGGQWAKSGGPADAPSDAREYTRLRNRLVKAVGTDWVRLHDPHADGSDTSPHSREVAEELISVMEEMDSMGVEIRRPDMVQIGPMYERDAGDWDASVSWEDGDTRLLRLRYPPNLPADVSVDDAYRKTLAGVVVLGLHARAMPQSPNLEGTAEVEMQNPYTLAPYAAHATLRGGIIHEIGHLQQPRRYSTRYRSDPAIPTNVARSVSAYALSNTDEFFAESFTTLFNGRPMSPDAHAAFRDLCLNGGDRTTALYNALLKRRRVALQGEP